MTQVSLPALAQTPTLTSWKIKLLYDGECPLCLREINFLKQRDAGRGIVAFVDIAAPDYAPSENGGIDYETAMGRIHALLPDGTILRDVAVFRSVYAALGLGWVYAITQWQPIEAIANLIYKLWAILRLPLTGRPNLKTIVAKRQQTLENQGRCRLER